MLSPRRDNRFRSRSGRVELRKGVDAGGEFPGAEDQLRQALAHNPQSDTLIKSLGDVLARQGRFTEASEAFDHALDLNPRRAAAHFGAIEARRCGEADRPRLGRMLAMLADATLGEEERLLLHFAVGKLLDDLGDYAEAMRHFDTANRIRGRNVEFDREAFEADIDRLVQRSATGSSPRTPPSGSGTRRRC